VRQADLTFAVSLRAFDSRYHKPRGAGTVAAPAAVPF